MSERGAHLDDATWERLAMGELAGPERSAAAEHIVACAECRLIHRGLRALEDGARAKGLLDMPRPAPRRSAAPWLAAAAGVVAMAAVIAFVVWPRGGEGGRVVRGGGDDVVDQTRATTTDGGYELAWGPVAGAAAYRVEVFDADGRPAWLTQVDTPPATWSAAGAPAGDYRWRVQALGADGQTIAGSALTPLVVEPGH